MKVASITGPRQAALIDLPDPTPGEDFAVVKIHVVPMCTEYKAYDKGSVTQLLGHEAAGEVVAVAQPGKVKVGDRVVVMPGWSCGKCPMCLAGEYIHCQVRGDPLAICKCQAGKATYAQYTVKADWLLLPIPDGMSYEHGAMACCGLGPTFAAAQRMAVDALDTVLVTGLGPVGLGAVINCAVRGARVIAADPVEYRRKLAMDIGAAAAIDPSADGALKAVMDLTGGAGPDKAVDCSGIAAAQRLAIDATRRRGQVSFVGESAELPVKISQDLIRKGLTLHGVWHWNLRDTPRMMQTIAAAGAMLDKVITHTFPLSRVADAWELQMTHQCGKVLLYPWK